MDAKQKKKRYGVTMAPIPCTEAWRRVMPFDHNSKGVVTHSFILVNRYTGERIHTNSYNGDAGVGYNAAKATYPIKGWHPLPHPIPWVPIWPTGQYRECLDSLNAEKNLAKSLNLGKAGTYSRCTIADCPMAVLAPAPEGWLKDVIVEPPLDAPLPGSVPVEAPVPAGEATT